MKITTKQAHFSSLLYLESDRSILWVFVYGIWTIAYFSELLLKYTLVLKVLDYE